MNRCSFCEWIPILPWPVWPLAGQFLLGQNVVVGSMMVLLALCGSMPRGVYLGPHFRYKCASPRLSAELPVAALGQLTLVKALGFRLKAQGKLYFARKVCRVCQKGLPLSLPEATERPGEEASR